MRNIIAIMHCIAVRRPSCGMTLFGAMGLLGWRRKRKAQAD